MPSSAVQTTVSVNPAAGFPGLEYDDSASDVVTLIATVAIPFGRLVYESAEGKCALPTATGNVTGGKTYIAMIDHNKPSGVGYEVGDAVRCMKRGRVWVATEEQLAFGDTLFARFAAGTAATLGAFRNDADTATASTPTNMSLYKSGSATAAVVQIGDIS
jgi:hypothetical protein